MEGVTVPPDVVNDGRAAAYAAEANGEISVASDRAFCVVCGTRNEFYHDRCRECGGPKPWIHRDEIRVDDRAAFEKRKEQQDVLQG